MLSNQDALIRVDTPPTLRLSGLSRRLRLRLAEEYNGSRDPESENALWGGRGGMMCRRRRFRCCQVFGSAC